MKRIERLSIITILKNMGVSRSLVLSNLVDGQAGRIITTSDQDAFLQKCNISHELFEKAVALSQDSRLNENLNSSLWDKIRMPSLEFGCPFWVQSVFEQSFREVSPVVNGGGDFIWRDFEIFSEKEKVTTEVIEAMTRLRNGLQQFAGDLPSSHLELWASMQPDLLDTLIGRDMLYVFIQQRVNKPKSSSLNWFYIAISLPEEELLFCRANIDMRNDGEL